MNIMLPAWMIDELKKKEIAVDNRPTLVIPLPIYERGKGDKECEEENTEYCTDFTVSYKI